MNCMRCDGTGFLNFHQVPSDIAEKEPNEVLEWLSTESGKSTDVSVCDCCGADGAWYGEPGRHYTADDPVGERGPYAYNGGLAECH